MGKKTLKDGIKRAHERTEIDPFFRSAAAELGLVLIKREKKPTQDRLLVRDRQTGSCDSMLLTPEGRLLGRPSPRMLSLYKLALQYAKG